MMTEAGQQQQPPPANSKAGRAEGGSLGWIRLNHLYFLTIPGFIKIIQLVLGIICMALASPAYFSATHWFLFVTVTSFIITLLLVIVYLLSIREAVKLNFDWLIIELIYTIVVTALYITAFIAQLAKWSDVYAYSQAWYNKNIAAGVVGLFNSIAYGVGAGLLFLEWRKARSAPAQ